NFEIGRILHLKSEIRNLESDSTAPQLLVQSEISDFGFEMQDSSNFKIPPHFNVGSNLQDNGQYKRTLCCLLIEELFQVLPDLFLDHSPIATFFHSGVSNRIRQHLFAFRKQPLFLDESDAPKDDLRRDFQHAGLFVNGNDGKDDAIF